MTTLVVPDYNEAIAFFTAGLGFDLVEDSDLGSGKRWVVVGGKDGGKLLLARAANDVQSAAVGNQAGGRGGGIGPPHPFSATPARRETKGARFEEAPRQEVFGTVAVFADPWGNRWDLIERKDAAV